MAYGGKKGSSKGKGKKTNKVCKTDSGHRPANPVEIAAFSILWQPKRKPLAGPATRSAAPKRRADDADDESDPRR